MSSSVSELIGEVGKVTSGFCSLCQEPDFPAISCSITHSLLLMCSFYLLDGFSLGISCLKVCPPSLSTQRPYRQFSKLPCISYKLGELTRQPGNRNWNMLWQQNMLGYYLFHPPHQFFYSCITVFAVFVVSRQKIRLPSFQCKCHHFCLPQQLLRGKSGDNGELVQLVIEVFPWAATCEGIRQMWWKKYKFDCALATVSPADNRLSYRENGKILEVL